MCLRQILYDLTYMWNLKKIKLVETGNRLVVSRGRGKGVGEMDKSFKRYKLPVI